MRRLLFTSASAVSLVLLLWLIERWVSTQAMNPLRSSLGWAVSVEAKGSALRPQDQPAKPGDFVTISLHDLVGPGIDITRSQRITSNGTMTLPLIKPVKVQGLTRAQTESTLARAYVAAGFERVAPAYCLIWKPAWRVPFWPLLVAFAVLPFTWVVSTIRQCRRKELLAAGRCAQCGYDLRATPHRCPECGRVSEAEL